jgi:hypothetical protein
VQKKRTERPGGKRDSAEISNTTGEEVEVSAFGSKKGIGKSGVHLRYHNSDDYKKLSKDQKDELREWRAKTGQGKGKGDKHEPKRKRVAFDSEKAIASAVTKQVAETIKANKQAKTSVTEAEAYIMSIFKKYAAGKSLVSDVTADKPPSIPSSLKGIIQRAKNAKTD